MPHNNGTATRHHAAGVVAYNLLAHRRRHELPFSIFHMIFSPLVIAPPFSSLFRYVDYFDTLLPPCCCHAATLDATPMLMPQFSLVAATPLASMLMSRAFRAI